jgi:anti-sigma B factor antagonist
MAAEAARQPANEPARNVEYHRYINDRELLTVNVQQVDGAILVIHIAGQLDMLTAPTLQDHLSELLATQPERLIINLSGVSFLGSNGLAVLIDTKEAATAAGVILELNGTSHRAVARPLAITGLACLFEIAPTDTESH